MLLIKRLIKSAIRWTGFRFYRMPPEKFNGPDMEYDLFVAHGFAPWLVDQSFREAYSIIEGATLVDRYRAYELWSLVSQSLSLAPGDYLEVGTWRGGTGCLIARRVKEMNPGARVFLADTFAGIVKAGAIDGGYVDGAHDDASVRDVEALASRMAVDVDVLQGIFPDDTGGQIENRKFRLCHIDVDVYQSAKDVLDWVWPRMVSGGIVVFDDYGFNSCPGVTRLVNEEAGKSDRMFLHNLNGHAIFIKMEM